MKCLYNFPNYQLTGADYVKIRGVLESGWICQGVYTAELEKRMRERFGCDYAIACASGTAGLVSILASWNTSYPYNRIAVPAFTWPSTLWAIQANGFEPIFCDIRDPLTDWSMVPNRVIRTKFAMPVDTLGFDGAYEDEDCDIIYDSAHGYGLDLFADHRRAKACVLSLSFTKPVTGGQGGVILFNDEDLLTNVKEHVKLTAKMMENNAITALRSMKQYDKYMSDRMEIIDRYTMGLDARIQLSPKETWKSTFSIIFPNEGQNKMAQMKLAEVGIESKIYYEPTYRYNSGYPYPGRLPNTEWLFARILALPVHEMAISFQPQIIDICNEVVK